MPATANEHPRIPLTRFHNNTGEFLDLATSSRSSSPAMAASGM